MTLMLGVSLAGREVLLVGGGAVTARRMRRFLDEGAVVRIVAPELHPAVAALVTEHSSAWERRRFQPGDLAGVWLVHVATGDARTDREIVALCERRRMLCIDAGDGAHGSVRMTAQLDAGGVAVGVVSTHGVDPRRSIAIRDAVGDLLADGRLPLRRRRIGGSGRVDLVGGGPGPADLMTVRARRLIAEADVVVTDRLGPAAQTVREIAPEALLIDVGKRPGHHPAPQDEINRILVEHALAGRRVVRLKGGDPFVFGRGGEEMRACLAAGVAVEVTPGPSSAIAVPQAAGIPVTHRGTAAAFHVVNGQGELSSSTLAALADPDVTTIVLMGVAALPRLVEVALRQGIAHDLPMAFVENGHTPRQRATRTILGEAVRDAERMGLSNPAVIVFGDVARADLLMPGAAAWEAAAS